MKKKKHTQTNFVRKSVLEIVVLVSHAIISSMQYYPKDIIAYARRTLLHMQ